jgi:signal transduction histidine kinase
LAVKGQIASGTSNPENLIDALQTSDAKALLRVDGTWYTAVVQFDKSAVPASLTRRVDDDGAARQRTLVDGQPYLAYGFRIPGTPAEYYEFVSAAEYERTLHVLAVILFVAASITTIGGAAAGWFISRRVLRPLTTVAESARSISDGNLSHRIDVGNDPDLRVVATAFNEMAGNVEARIEREHRFTADVSHELRTPLTALGAAVSLAQRGDLDDRGRLAMDILQQELQHFQRLTIELLEISRIDAGMTPIEYNDVDVVPIARRVLEQAGHDATVIHASAGSVAWRLDPIRIERVLANLVENAQRYAGGVAELSIDVCGDSLVISVDDAGPGVPAQERSAIFGRFSRGSMAQPPSQPKGTGLGLALVDEHVRMHGGEAYVTDSAFGGARFVVKVPRIP